MQRFICVRTAAIAPRPLHFPPTKPANPHMGQVWQDVPRKAPAFLTWPASPSPTRAELRAGGMRLFVEGLKRARAYMFAPGLGPLFVRSLAGSSIIRIASMLASFAVGVQLARGLGVSGYGYYGLALSIITMGAIPGELGLSRLVTREVSTATVRGDDAELFAIIRWADRTCWT